MDELVSARITAVGMVATLRSSDSSITLETVRKSVVGAGGWET